MAYIAISVVFFVAIFESINRVFAALCSAVFPQAKRIMLHHQMTVLNTDALVGVTDLKELTCFKLPEWTRKWALVPRFLIF
ncbi:hypothetical protein IEQ34_003673 [Dendrobium chrysotoxum]|uniref:Secreted protein n=1 Tax=Dendrobium chrysotoxum TaxID=161865 RepID=A0AAV7HE52_DENCH|nr:hypothetical protein IEQ34_003673 [Dendrobium chrysotoxum]